jgi:hypothetical protein
MPLQGIYAEPLSIWGALTWSSFPGKLNCVCDINKDLQEKLDLAERRLESLEKKVGVEVQAGDDRLRKARATMARLEKETERHLSEPGS